jgi:hypothetical protein
VRKKILVLLLAVIALMGTTSYASTSGSGSETQAFKQEVAVNLQDPNLPMASQASGSVECTDPSGRCFAHTPYGRPHDDTAEDVKTAQLKINRGQK